MPVMLERWNDDKMDGLSEKVDGLGEQMREQRRETREQRKEMREWRQEMKGSVDRIDERFDRLYHVLIGAAAAIVVAVISAPHL